MRALRLPVIIISSLAVSSSAQINPADITVTTKGGINQVTNDASKKNSILTEPQGTANTLSDDDAKDKRLSEVKNQLAEIRKRIPPMYLDTSGKEDRGEKEWWAIGSPPPGWLMRLEDTILKRVEDPDYDNTPEGKNIDQWTVTPKFRRDLIEATQKILGMQYRDWVESNPSKDPVKHQKRIKVVIEVGCYIGYTTQFLSKYFDLVICVEAEPAFNQLNQLFNSGMKNIMWMETTSQLIDHGDTRRRVAEVVNGDDSLLSLFYFLDAAHDYQSVYGDIKSMREKDKDFKYHKYIFFDDYAAEPAVQDVLATLVGIGWLEFVEEIGEQVIPMADGRTVRGSEGVVCRLLPYTERSKVTNMTDQEVEVIVQNRFIEFTIEQEAIEREKKKKEETERQRRLERQAKAARGERTTDPAKEKAIELMHEEL